MRRDQSKPDRAAVANEWGVYDVRIERIPGTTENEITIEIKNIMTHEIRYVRTTEEKLIKRIFRYK